MFGIGLPELILIMGIALIVVGPERLPELAKTIARQMVELKRAANSFKDSIQNEMGEGIDPGANQLPAAYSRPEELAAKARQAVIEESEARLASGGTHANEQGAGEDKVVDPPPENDPAGSVND